MNTTGASVDPANFESLLNADIPRLASELVEYVHVLLGCLAAYIDFRNVFHLCAIF